MSATRERLYPLLPLVYRQRDALQGWPLRALLQVIDEQVEILENDIDQLYRNWFIETCEDWVIPYIGDLVGNRLASGPSEEGCRCGGAPGSPIVSRREVAHTIRHRRRKGTVALLEELAEELAGWPSRAVEFYRGLALCGHVNFPNPARGRTIDLRQGESLLRLGGPFDSSARTVDVRNPRSGATVGRYNIPSLGLFVWRLQAFPSTGTLAYCIDQKDSCYTFSPLGNDTPLFTSPRHGRSGPRGPLDVPDPIRRRTLKRLRSDYYGKEKSFEIRVGPDRELVPVDRIQVADLEAWHYQARREKVLVDPERGRIAFPPGSPADRDTWVSYHYGFSAPMGGGEYPRTTSEPAGARKYRVRQGVDPDETARLYSSLAAVLKAWHEEKPEHAVIEIEDSGVYSDPIYIGLPERHSLTIRSAPGTRPVLWLLDHRPSRPDAFAVGGEAGSRFTLEGVVVTGRPVRLEGSLARFTLRHSTLVPGWGLTADCHPLREGEPSLDVRAPHVCIDVNHSILGLIHVKVDAVKWDPIRVCLEDSILDAGKDDREAFGSPGCPVAHAVVVLRDCTVIGRVEAHAIELAENSIITGHIGVARSQIGCMRFSWVDRDSHTPKRFECQPETAMRDAFTKALAAAVEERRDPTAEELAQAELARAEARERVRPHFNDTRYGMPSYAQLADDCPEEITQGADDRSEMGAFHDLFQPQREANLIARIDEHTPASVQVGVIRVT
ncbi:MAG TPA: hypothetical protein VFP58_12100 [Candidatus Eisenbacteria bacterium]|nr:hypothetical protein [Candidatus Eisenbacteria bacterium]